MLPTGMFVADKCNAEQAYMVTVVAAESLAWSQWHAWQYFLLCLLPQRAALKIFSKVTIWLGVRRQASQFSARPDH